MDAELEASALWTAFLAGSDAKSQARVERLVDAAAGILDRIVETFPTYTLHDRRHALNVVKQMGNLLGKEGCERLRGLEAAMLILSAYWHDIGMYYKPDELTQVTQEEAFERFLEAHSQAFVDFERNGAKPTQGLVEWYCRWNHADRVYRFLNSIPDDELSWKHFPLRTKLGELCRSHNQSLDFLKDDDRFETDWIGECDLRFCAILLRLADILDFDRSRSPEFVYHHLGLASGDSARLRASNVEWEKHRASSGFRFPAGKRESPYLLPFGASPDDPNVEHDTREFLKVIDDELKGCSSLLRSCSDRWRDHPLPQQTRPDIYPKGYVYGDYRFELDRHQILSLFMGEKLYSSPYAFLRELLQNAIDTTRHRTFFERKQHAPGFEPQPIEVSEWLDEDGSRWIRIDDFGMGMNQELVLEYFLSIGRSYYRSSDFRAELLRYAAGGAEAFTPISRFGIGVLSCFIVGDRVEVSTRRARTGPEDDPPLRLSLQGLESFYTLQMLPLPPAPMPSRFGPDRDYRSEAGTSIAVRLDPAREPGGLDVSKLLARYLLASPVPVTHHGEPVRAASELVAEQPWVEGIEEFNASWPEQGSDGQHPVTVAAIPLDLTSASPDPRLKGQLVVLAATIRDGDRMLAEAEAADEPETALAALQARVEADLKLWGGYTISDVTSDRWVVLSSESVYAEVDLADLLTSGAGRLALTFNHPVMRWTHNGVTLPEKLTERDPDMLAAQQTSKLEELLSLYPRMLRDGVRIDLGADVIGVLSLADQLQVELPAARDVVSRVPWRVRSLIQLTILRACRAADHPFVKRLLADRPLGIALQLSDVVPPLDVILDDPSVAGVDDWSSVPLLVGVPEASTPSSHPEFHRPRSDAEPVERVLQEHGSAAIDLPANHGRPLSFSGVLRLYLARTRHHVVWAPLAGIGPWRWVATQHPPLPITEGERSFPPLFSATYPDDTLLRADHGPVNRDHPLMVWLFAADAALQTHYPGARSVIVNDLSEEYYGDRLEERLDRLNATLETLRDRNFEPRPPAELKLRREDFV